MKIFSSRNRAAWKGSYPSERLARVSDASLERVPAMTELVFRDATRPESLANAMVSSIALLDTTRDGAVNPKVAVIPDDPVERSRNLKGAGYFFDAGEVGICALPDDARLSQPRRNPDIAALSQDLQTRQLKAFSSGLDHIMATLREAASRPETSIDDHTHAAVFLYEHPRDPDPDEPGGQWIAGTNPHRAALRAAECAVVLANYLRLLGYSARAHTSTTTDVDLNKLTVAAGLATVFHGPEGDELRHPFVGRHFGVAVVTTAFELAPDLPLAADPGTGGFQWKVGVGTGRRAATARSYMRRRFADGLLPFETIRRVEDPTTFIDELRVPRVPKRTDMFPRSQFGDFGKKMQDQTIGGHFLEKNPVGWAPRMILSAFVLLQNGEVAPRISDHARDPASNAECLKAALYFLGVDAVGLSRCPDWVYYSHDANGEPIEPYHGNAITMMVDQGRDDMDGSSGDDWLSGAQSMRAYLRNNILGCVVAAQIRALGYEARVHSSVDGEVLQPPLSLISGMGEVSRIGEVILHPLLGPRLKTGVVTTNMPFVYDKPIDFGLQKFCEQCNKCARECPSGAITAGPKTMFNGYEIWKSDSQKCMNYRLTNDKGSMCGRCMKTCPWNLEGLFAEKPFRWMATNMPALAPHLARLDDRLGNGKINPAKKWWWDIELDDERRYVPAGQSNERGLQTDLDLKFEDQTLAVYPAPLAPHPWPFPFPADREAGIQAYRAMLSPDEHKQRIASGDTENLVPPYSAADGEAPVLRLDVKKVDVMTKDISRFQLAHPKGEALPPFDAGAHIEVLVAPEFLREYSLSGDPADRSVYEIGVLREEEGRGGSKLLHRIFNEGRKVFVSRPKNEFPLVEGARHNLLLAGGVGVTPMIAMAHQLHASAGSFRLHYSYPAIESAAYLDTIEAAPWRNKVSRYCSSDGTRVDLDALLSTPDPGTHIYMCGPDRYIEGVQQAAEKHGWPEDSVHLEYFSAPETPEYVNFPFTLKLAKSGRVIEVAAQESATDALERHGIIVDIKCSDGICGVCKCSLVTGEVEHRDFCLSREQRKTSLILCQSRAAENNGTVEIDM